ncbi:hypothetical protein [Meridianimarinicoccus marinus]|uniref:hypothetical protein n=1 Tax=Meridianimarinicoccus marinus TaxID=3231483 RepID=UPI003F4EAC8A
MTANVENGRNICPSSEILGQMAVLALEHLQPVHLVWQQIIVLLQIEFRHLADPGFAADLCDCRSLCERPVNPAFWEQGSLCEADQRAIWCPAESDGHQNMGQKKGPRNSPQEFKRRVVGQALSAPSIAAVARQYELNANMVHLRCKDMVVLRPRIEFPT